MAEIVSEWLHFDTARPTRKRAELVCSSCHRKKIKCDLQSQRGLGQPKCTNCTGTSRECHVRPSKRRKNGNQVPPNRDIPHKHRSPPSVSPTSDAHVNSINVAMNPPPAPPPQHQSPIQLPQHESPHSQRTPHSSVADLPGGPATCRSNQSDVDTGFLQVYGPENQYDAVQQELEATLERGYSHIYSEQEELISIFAETYTEYCYAWCPVLDIDRLHEDTMSSPLLANSLALAASHIRPPLVPHEGPASYYEKARKMFYNDEEADGIKVLQGVALFYWWAPRPPTVAHRHSSWWWNSVLVRHAQQMNFHREPATQQVMPLDSRVLSLRRRIWWTAFARERLTALCQSKPCIIDPLDCNIQEPTLADFPSDPRMQKKGEIFIYWVRLCGIMGDVAKYLARSSASSSNSFPSRLRQQLIDWVHSLPPHLQLPIGTARTAAFDRDVHQLFLPYFTTIIILHLKRSAHALPQALPPAILAASCIARILRDILSRGDARFLMPITCWYSGTAFISLLQASRIENLSKDANEAMDILTNAVEQLQQMWASANIIRQGIDRLRSSEGPTIPGSHIGPGSGAVLPPDSARSDPASLAARVEGGPDGMEESDWVALFPFVTPSTSRIAEFLLPGKHSGHPPTRFPSPENALFHETLMTEYQDLLEPFGQFGALNFEPMGFAE
ncbi:hypothetical protein BX600DRAFT_447708 [Xylariales sp. PMI_506]|nr:hypothetical protein BX600DRAFT_447708 [Xylariales sp. PMI_506]